MGVEYMHYIYPRPLSAAPSASQIARLAGELERHRWVLAPTAPGFGELAERLGGSNLAKAARKTGMAMENGNRYRAVRPPV